MLSRALERNQVAAVLSTGAVAASILAALPKRMFLPEAASESEAEESGSIEAAHAAATSPVRTRDTEAPSSGTRARRKPAGVAASRTSSGDLLPFESQDASAESSPSPRPDLLAGHADLQYSVDDRQDSLDSFGSAARLPTRGGSSSPRTPQALTPGHVRPGTDTQAGIINGGNSSPVTGGIGAVSPPTAGAAQPPLDPPSAAAHTSMDAVARAAVRSLEMDSDSDSDGLVGTQRSGERGVPPSSAPATPLSPTHTRKQTLMMSMSPPIKIAAKDISEMLGALEGGEGTLVEQDEGWQGGSPGGQAEPAQEIPAAADSSADEATSLASSTDLSSKQASARANILNEILASERTYISSLQGLVGVFVEPLAGEPQPAMQYLHHSTASGRMLLEGTAGASASRNLLSGGASPAPEGVETSQQRSARQLLSQMEHSQLFGGVDTLVPLHQHLLAQLRRAVAAAQSSHDGPTSPTATSTGGGLVTPAIAATVCFGDIFTKLSNFFKMYSSYVANHAGANELLVHLQDTNKGFKEWIQAAQQQPGTRGQPLQSLLIMPVQRVPRYELLLTSLLKHTPPHLPDHADLEQALQRVKTAARAINTNITLFLTQRAVLQIQRCLIPEPEPSLVTPSRRFVREGALKKLTKGSMRPYTVFLFTDKLVYGANGSGISGTLSSLFNRSRRSSAVGTPSNKRTGGMTPTSRQKVIRAVARKLPLGASAEEPPSSAPGRQLRTFSSEASVAGTAASSDAGSEETPPAGGMTHAHSTGEIGLVRSSAAAAGASPPPFTASAANSESALTALTAAVTTDSDKPREKVSLHCIIDFEAVESLPDSDKAQHAFVVRGLPKDITLVAPDEHSKAQWLASIRSCLYEKHLAGGGSM